MEVLAWNAESPMILANAGPTTQRGSLVEKMTGGGCLDIRRQDDYGQMEANLAKFITSNGANGDAFFIIMGDAYPYVTGALNGLGLQGQYSAISAIGFSDGEDQCMLPSNWRELMKAGTPILIAAVPRDGDWNICVKFAADNGIKVNVSQKTVDADAFNFVDVNAFTDADEKLISKACEDRTLVKDKLAHNTVHVCVNGVATWTPGDKDVVEKFDGSIVGVASTHDYAGQMPALIIGGKDWMSKNHDYVVGLLKAADRGAMAIRLNGAMAAMDAANQAVFQDKNMKTGDWAAYYRGMIGTNRAGERVRLGGSKAITLQEARDYFGLRAGNVDTFAADYRVFKKYDEDFYPDLYPKTGTKAIPAYEDVVDLTYLKDALADVPTTAPVNVAVLPGLQGPITRVVSKKAWHIEFDTGRASIKRDSIPLLKEIADSAAISSNLSLKLEGFTDNTGSNTVNIPLSQARAEAVRDYLHGMAAKTFPLDKFEVVGSGSNKPLCEDSSEECRKTNRRVEITQGD
jgi:outer membrane protein OmpA-like peptidoglycan-associated protein